MHYKKIMILFAILTPLCVILRTGQLLLFTDSRGFFLSSYARIGFDITVLLCAAGVLTAVFGMMVHRCPTRMPHVSWELALVALFLGLWTAYSAFADTGVGVPSWQMFLLRIVAAACCIYFIAYAAKGVISYKLPPFLSLAPLFYWLVRTLVMFTKMNSLIITSGLVLMLLGHCAMLLFWLCFTKAANKIDPEYNFKKLLAFSLSGILLEATYVLPNVIRAAAKGTTDALPDGLNETVLLLANILFAFVFTVCFYSNHNLKHHRRHHNVRFQPGVPTENFYMGMRTSSHRHHHHHHSTDTDAKTDSVNTSASEETAEEKAEPTE